MGDAPVRYFILAGMENVLGPASITHLEQLIFDDNVADLQEFVDDFGFVERDDAFVTFKRQYGRLRDNLEGRLSADLYGADADSFGPEAGFGFELADNFDEDVVIIKAAGVSALAEDWLPPSSDGSGIGGEFFNLMIADIQASIARVDEITGSSGREATLCGVVWWNGYADVDNEDFLNSYQDNLSNFIGDLRSDLGLPNLPFVIGSVGGGGDAPSDAESTLRGLQNNVVRSTPGTILSNTEQYVTQDVVDSPICDRATDYYCNAQVMVNIGRQLASDMLQVANCEPLSESTGEPTATNKPSGTDTPSGETVAPSSGDSTLSPAPTSGPTGGQTGSPSLSNRPTFEGETFAPTALPTAELDAFPTRANAEEATVSPSGEVIITPSPTVIYRYKGKRSKKGYYKQYASKKSKKSSKKSSKKGYYGGGDYGGGYVGGNNGYPIASGGYGGYDGKGFKTSEAYQQQQQRPRKQKRPRNDKSKDKGTDKSGKSYKRERRDLSVSNILAP